MTCVDSLEKDVQEVSVSALSKQEETRPEIVKGKENHYVYQCLCHWLGKNVTTRVNITSTVPLLVFSPMVWEIKVNPKCFQRAIQRCCLLTVMAVLYFRPLIIKEPLLYQRRAARIWQESFQKLSNQWTIIGLFGAFSLLPCSFILAWAEMSSLACQVAFESPICSKTGIIRCLSHHHHFVLVFIFAVLCGWETLAGYESGFATETRVLQTQPG